MTYRRDSKETFPSKVNEQQTVMNTKAPSAFFFCPSQQLMFKGLWWDIKDTDKRALLRELYITQI